MRVRDVLITWGQRVLDEHYETRKVYPPPLAIGRCTNVTFMAIEGWERGTAALMAEIETDGPRGLVSHEVDPDELVAELITLALSPTLPPETGGTPGSDGVQPGSAPEVSSPNG